MTPAIQAAEAEVKAAQAKLTAAVAEAFPVGKVVQAKDFRGLFNAAVIGHGTEAGAGNIALRKQKDNSELNRHYTKVTVL